MKTALLPKSSKPTLLAALVAGALGIAPSAMAAFLVAESNTGKAELYNATGTHLVTFASGLSAPIGVAEGGGNVYIAEYGGGVKKYSTTGTAMGVVNSNSSTFGHGPAGLAYINGRIHNAAYNIGTLTSSVPDAGWMTASSMSVHSMTKPSRATALQTPLKSRSSARSAIRSISLSPRSPSPPPSVFSRQAP